MSAYQAPVGTAEERASGAIWPGAWLDATGFATRYRIGQPNEAYHTGADLNLNKPHWDADRLAPVVAIADGVVTTVQRYAVWGWIIVIHHTPSGGPFVYARYAHIAKPLVSEGQRVTQGQQIASVGNADGAQAYHLHFDISPTDILRWRPNHWPKLDLAALREHYVDPKAFLQGDVVIDPVKPIMVYTTADLNVRSQPSTQAKILRVLPVGAAVAVTAENTAWYKLTTEGYIFRQFTSATPPAPPWKPPITATMRGIHAAAGGWAPSDLELNLVRLSNIKAALIVAYEAGQSHAIARFRSAGVEQFILRAAVHDMADLEPMRFLNRTLPILAEYAAALGRTDGLMIALHNEPNLYQEGFSHEWSSGGAFAAWFRLVAATLRDKLPGCKIGFPALSPGGAVPDVRADEAAFIGQARTAIDAADWIGVHYYWTHPDGFDIAAPIQRWKQWFGNKPLIGTEIGPGNDTQITAHAAGAAYRHFAQISIPMCCWLLSGSGAWQNAAWDLNSIVVGGETS